MYSVYSTHSHKLLRTFITLHINTNIPPPLHLTSGDGQLMPFTIVFGRVVDPDPDWIRIQSGLWIRIWISIRNPDPDPDPGGQK